MVLRDRSTYSDLFFFVFARACARARVCVILQITVGAVHEQESWLFTCIFVCKHVVSTCDKCIFAFIFMCSS